MSAPANPVRRSGSTVVTVLGALLALALLGAATFVVLVLLHLYRAEPLVPSPAAVQTPQTGSGLAEHGAYLARVGNCMQCHTAQGGAPYAGRPTSENSSAVAPLRASSHWPAMVSGMCTGKPCSERRRCRALIMAAVPAR